MRGGLPGGMLRERLASLGREVDLVAQHVDALRATGMGGGGVGPSGESSHVARPFTEEKDDGEVVETPLRAMDTDKSGTISRDELNSALDRCKGHAEMAGAQGPARHAHRLRRGA